MSARRDINVLPIAFISNHQNVISLVTTDRKRLFGRKRTEKRNGFTADGLFSLRKPVWSFRLLPAYNSATRDYTAVVIGPSLRTISTHRLARHGFSALLGSTQSSRSRAVHTLTQLLARPARSSILIISNHVVLRMIQIESFTSVSGNPARHQRKCLA